MSPRICTSVESHIHRNGDLEIELNDGCLCGIKVRNTYICTPINLVRTRPERGSLEIRSP
jgi:hypothetical protein